MTGPAPDVARVCHAIGFRLVTSGQPVGWRITKDAYVHTRGITGVLVNDRVGPLPPVTPDRRGRYDTLGRLVSFAATAKTALAEVLGALSGGGDVAGQGRRRHRDGRPTISTRLADDIHSRGLPGPGEVSVDWQMASSLYQVPLPVAGWWVTIDCAATLNALSDKRGGALDQLAREHGCGQDRGLTTQLAQVIRESVLDDGSLPLGMSFPSKTGYGRCWAWWNRRGDDKLNQGGNEPKLIDGHNVGTRELHEICADWDLQLVRSEQCVSGE